MAVAAWSCPSKGRQREHHDTGCEVAAVHTGHKHSSAAGLWLVAPGCHSCGQGGLWGGPAVMTIAGT